MKRVIENKIVIVIILCSVIFAWFFNAHMMKEYERYNTDSIDYIKAEVVEITSQNVEYDTDLKINMGHQDLVIKILEGEQQGETANVTNYLTTTHNVDVKIGSKVIINADRPTDISPYYTVYNFDRTIGLFGGIALLMMTIIAVGKGKGLKAILGLTYSLFIIVGILLPAVFSGYSPIVMSIIIGILSTLVTLLLLNGESIKTYGACISTILGLLISLVFFSFMSYILHINGFSVSEVEALVLVSRGTGLQIKDVLFAGVLISSLGAIMDVGMSIVSALYEVYYHKPDITTNELFASGIEIGKDMIGTMSNTLILAFTGGAFVSLLSFLSYGLELNQLLSSNYLTIEITQGVCGTLGIVLTVPIASIVAATMLTKKTLVPKMLKKNDTLH